MCYHLDIYRSITNDHINNLRKEAYENRRRMRDNDAMNWWMNTNMLFILFFRSGKG
ncbi:hypothetical protein [Oceanobacillus manasiensis]|uniref:hypothetical protein n=1 Tax=Oceanobacillus manasiensis TaxID=586413 RepID=UPI000A74BA5A|nr:hypothetical protein [Oceanobacillus manasiensis]